jgi:hypothetical protein
VLFRILLFILLVVIGYYFSRKVRDSRISSTAILLFLGAALIFFAFISKRLLSLWSFSFYFVLVVIGLLIGFLAGMKRDQSGRQ